MDGITLRHSFSEGCTRLLTSDVALSDGLWPGVTKEVYDMKENHEFAEPTVQDEERESRSSLVWPSQAALKQSLLQELLGREQLQFGQELFQVSPDAFQSSLTLCGCEFKASN